MDTKRLQGDLVLFRAWLAAHENLYSQPYGKIVFHAHESVAMNNAIDTIAQEAGATAWQELRDEMADEAIAYGESLVDSLPTTSGNKMNRDQAIELARIHAKAQPQSYYSEPFQPHEWVIAAILEAAATAEQNLRNFESSKVTQWAHCPPCKDGTEPCNRACGTQPVAPVAAQEPTTMPNLLPVINWLENGCDPKEAAKELRVYQELYYKAPPTPAAIDGAQEPGMVDAVHGHALMRWNRSLGDNAPIKIGKELGVARKARELIASQPAQIAAPVAAQERDKALEEAALECEKLTIGPNGDYRLHLATKEDFRACAEAIRALKAHPTPVAAIDGA